MTGRPSNVRAPAVYRVAPHLLRASSDEFDPLARSPEIALVEAALIGAEEPLTTSQLAAVAAVSEPEASQLVTKLTELYELDQTAFQIAELAGGYQLLTRPVYHLWLTRLSRAGSEFRLSAPLLETLAVVAYRQPVTRADVEAVRGSAASDALRTLVERGFVRLAGRQNTLGRPQLYATTRQFLRMYGLASLQDLPAADASLPAPSTPISPGVRGVPVPA